MTTSRSLIVIKGEVKTNEVASITQNKDGSYQVRFANGGYYTYQARNIEVLDLCDEYDPKHCQIFVRGREYKDLKGIWLFVGRKGQYWRLENKQGSVYEYEATEVVLRQSCLRGDKTERLWDYLKAVARLNPLGREEGRESLLYNQYASIRVVDDSLALAPFIRGEKPQTYEPQPLIFPFSCNASQRRAVERAFSSQVSLIQGPPGTGKTQTILNIIANILLQGKTVLVVSNNNSATANVLEKLTRYGFDFVVAALGRHDNKEQFVKTQQTIPVKIAFWSLSDDERVEKHQRVKESLTNLERIFALQETLASSRQQEQALSLEWGHFKQAHPFAEAYQPSVVCTASRLMDYWRSLEEYIEYQGLASKSLRLRLQLFIRYRWILFKVKRLLRIKSRDKDLQVQDLILRLQTLYYRQRLEELRQTIQAVESTLSSSNGAIELRCLEDNSMALLQDSLWSRYSNRLRKHYAEVEDIAIAGEDFLNDYPIVLSTSFSARTSISKEVVYDYLIIDEASQVSIDTGALALSCARNTVIVGDALQLPNVLTNEDRQQLSSLFEGFDLSESYDCSRYSFLQSVALSVPDAPETLLREHYRCHPRIINFCNQKFYGGELLIMTQENDAKDTMMAFCTVPGRHSRGHYNQREIDVIKQEVLPLLKCADLGIITPYNDQVQQFLSQLPEVEVATVHKYQGREKDAIVMSVVDDTITTFSDDPNLLNVAVSRAKQQFILVVSGNEQVRQGNISDLIEYIRYNNFEVRESKVRSVFDYLYSQYTEQRLRFLRANTSISDFASENLVYTLLSEVLGREYAFRHLGILCHFPLRELIADPMALPVDLRAYALHPQTHLDFLLINKVSKLPVLAVEVDGYSYHHAQHEQYQRDLKKNSICEICALPLLRLSTTGSEEELRIVTTLRKVLDLEEESLSCV